MSKKKAPDPSPTPAKKMGRPPGEHKMRNCKLRTTLLEKAEMLAKDGGEHTSDFLSRVLEEPIRKLWDARLRRIDKAESQSE